MPNITVSFSDAQWTRIVAASERFQPLGATGDIDATKMAAVLKTIVEKTVKAHEQSKAHKDADAGLSSF